MIKNKALRSDGTQYVSDPDLRTQLCAIFIFLRLKVK
jgi:hypothetical protein